MKARRDTERKRSEKWKKDQESMAPRKSVKGRRFRMRWPVVPNTSEYVVPRTFKK